MANGTNGTANIEKSTGAGAAGHVPCVLCGPAAEAPEVQFEAGVAQPARIVKCDRCDLMYSSPRARAADHELHEQSNAIGALTGVETDPTHRYRWRLEKERGQVRDFAPTRALLNRLYPEQGRVVEVGSGMGYLLRDFKEDGWDVLGVDPWRALPEYTCDTHGIETLPATLEQAALPAGSIDVVVLLHVIEHVPDPVATLSEIRRVLKPGGHLVIETPRYDTAMFRMLKHRERSLRCEGHIYFFTFDTLRRTYEAAGFSEVDTCAVGRTLSMDRFLWNVGTVAGRPALSERLNRLSKKVKLDRLKFTLNLRDMQRVVVRKAP